MSRYEHILLVIMFFCGFLNAQDTTRTHNTQPFPAIGWDSLQANMRYPEILRRLAMEGAVYVYARFDSTGAVDTLVMNANHEIFKASVSEAIMGTKWIPANYSGRPSAGSILFNVHFYVKSPLRRISVEVEEAKPIRSY